LKKSEFKSKNKSGLSNHIKAKHKNSEMFNYKLCEFTTESAKYLLKHGQVHEYQKYENMNDDDQFEVKEEICGHLCWGGYYKFVDHMEDNELMGVIVRKIRN
jgi:hypothetical protein